MLVLQIWENHGDWFWSISKDNEPFIKHEGLGYSTSVEAFREGRNKLIRLKKTGWE